MKIVDLRLAVEDDFDAKAFGTGIIADDLGVYGSVELVNENGLMLPDVTTGVVQASVNLERLQKIHQGLVTGEVTE